MKKFIVGMILLGLAGMASAELLAGYDFQGDDPSVTSNHGDMTATTFGTGAGLNDVYSNWGMGGFGNTDAEGNEFGSASAGGFGGKGAAFGYKEADGSATYAATLADSLANNVYMTFSVTPENGKFFDLESFTFLHLRGSNASRSAGQWALYSSVGGFTIGNEIATGTNTLQTTWVGNVVTLGDEFNNVNSEIEFRLYIYGATSADVNKDDSTVDKVILNGTVIPEPDTIGMLSLGAMITLVIRRPLKV